MLDFDLAQLIIIFLHALQKQAEEVRPVMITAGASAYAATFLARADAAIRDLRDWIALLELRRQRTISDAGRVRFDNANDLIDVARPDRLTIITSLFFSLGLVSSLAVAEKLTLTVSWETVPLGLRRIKFTESISARALLKPPAATSA